MTAPSAANNVAALSDDAHLVLQVEDLCKTFSRKGREDVVAVDHVSFQVRAGECVGLVGESGSGKTTVASIVACLQRASSGSVVIDGRDACGLQGADLRRIYRFVQMVFQNPASSFDARQSLGEGIGEGLRNQYRLSRADARKRAEKLLARCGLPADYYGRYAREVSGGQCQRAAIARALAVEPRLLICDEATSALDVTVQKQIVELLADIRRSTSMGMLFICHDIALTQEICDYVLVMQAGCVVEQGLTNEVIGNPQHAYTRQLIEAVL